MAYPKITKANYYKNKTHLTNSMIGDYLRSPEYYAKKHVLGVIDNASTPAMQLGSAVDCWLTEGETKFRKLYDKKVLKKEDADLFEEQKDTKKTLLTPDTWEKVEVMVTAVKRTPAFKWLAQKSKMQVILTGVIDKIPVKGRPDFVTISEDKKTAWIDDLKTTVDVSVKKYSWSCYTWGYYRQACMYKTLLKQKYPTLEKVVSRHIVVTKDSDAPLVQVFLLNEDRVDSELLLIKETLHKMYVMKDFEPFKPSWADAIEIGDFDSSNE